MWHFLSAAEVRLLVVLSAAEVRLLVVGLVFQGLVVFSADSAHAWLDGGHVVVAQIAYDRLSPEARREADRLIGVLADQPPERADFVTAAVWLDDLKEGGWRAFDRWHYINLPYNADGAPSMPPVYTDNVLEAIEQAASTLKRHDAPALARAFSLRVLVHLVGDIHQPLHCVQRFSVDHPEGDRGGNSFVLLGSGDLHRYWDDAAGMLGDLGVGSSREDIAATAAALARAVPEAQVPTWIEPDPAIWARESYGLAVDVAYVGISEGRGPSESYATRVQLVTRRRLVVAGYRLAAMLDSLLSPAAARGD